MGKIKILPDTLISQIAAGEVVERPASVVKELLENSLDAGAKFCLIEIEQGGIKLIKVRDNGCGMDRQDAKMAFSRHATSKISRLEDLSNIKSFGFRGEALSAIASVSMTTLRTRLQSAEEGFEIVCKGGKFESENSIGCASGTEIEVRNLFFNTPARKKFLKSETTELGHIVAVASHMAIANPAVGFELKHNGKLLLRAPSSSSKIERLSAILGKNLLQDILSVSFKTETIHIHGFVGQPGMALSSKRHQYLFINGRDISDPIVSRAICDAYGSRLPARTWPMFILHIDIDPQEVDVNVHPRKFAVKFLDTQRVYRDVSQAVSQALESFQNKIFAPSLPEKTQNYPEPQKTHGVQAAIEFTQNFTEQEKREEGLSRISAQIIGQIADCYILILDEEGIAVIDQHAAHERILYEKFKQASFEKSPQKQALLIPLNIECSREEAVFLNQAAAHLEAIGFEFDKWSGNTFVVRACPASLKSENLDKIFRDFLNEMIDERKKEHILPEKILKSLACKAAIKFGMKILPEEQKNLLMELKKTPNSSTCPHGRPTRVLLSFEELEKRFYRRK